MVLMVYIKIMQIIKEKYRGKSFPLWLFFFLLFIFVLNAAAIIFHWYLKFFWLDMAVHTMGGIWTAGVALWFFDSVGEKEKPLDAKRIFLISLVAVVSVGILWEIFEIIVDMLTQSFMYDFIDGLSDIFFDILGASFVVVHTIWFRHARFA